MAGQEVHISGLSEQEISGLANIYSQNFYKFLSFVIYKRKSKSGNNIRISVIGFENDIKRFLNTLYDYIGNVNQNILVILEKLEKIQNSPYMSMTLRIEYDLWKRIYDWSIRIGYYNLAGHINLSRIFFDLGLIPSRINLEQLNMLLSSTETIKNLVEQEISIAENLLGVGNLAGQDFSDWGRDINIQNVSENTTTKKTIQINYRTIISGCAVKTITETILSTLSKTQTTYLPPDECETREYTIEISTILNINETITTKIGLILSGNCSIYGITYITKKSITRYTFHS